MSDQYNFIHIPKTGGTAIKYALETTPNSKINFPERGHSLKLNSVKNNACFIIREPWLRFCSAYWERATMEERREISKTKNVKSFGYASLSSDEKRMLSLYKTPDELVTYMREGGRLTGILAELTAPHTLWLGNVEQYQRNEEKVVMACALKNIDAVMKEKFGLLLPKDPFMKRSRAVFKQRQSYDISYTNKVWFEEQRKEEYELLEYIRGGTYFYG